MSGLAVVTLWCIGGGVTMWLLSRTKDGREILREDALVVGFMSLAVLLAWPVGFVIFIGGRLVKRVFGGAS